MATIISKYAGKSKEGKNQDVVPPHVQGAMGSRLNASLSGVGASYNETIGIHQLQRYHHHFFHRWWNVNDDFEAFPFPLHVSEKTVKLSPSSLRQSKARTFI